MFSENKGKHRLYEGQDKPRHCWLRLTHTRELGRLPHTAFSSLSPSFAPCGEGCLEPPERRPGEKAMGC